jgi:hypothetical protein
MNRNFLFLGILALAFLNGCGSAASPGPGPQPIAVVISTAPPATIVAGGIASVAATVSNDTAAAGVTWSCTPVGTCGSFNPVSTASAAMTTFTAPASSPAGGKVTIVATSVTDASKSANATVIITSGTIVVVISTAPPSTIVAGGTASVAATVSNDTAAAGVTWSCTPAGTCGSFNPMSTASAAMTTYTAPASSPAGGKVTIIATSVTDVSKSANATVTISGIASKATLNGKYVFFITAPAGNRKASGGTWGTTTFIGSVTLDGAGNVTGGEEDLISPGFADNGADPILPTNPSAMPFTSFYTVDASGHGTMRILTMNNETIDFSFVLTSASHALIVEADGNPGSGSLDLQQPAAGVFAASQISGGYSFTMTGPNSSNPATKISLGGVFTANGAALTMTNVILDVNSGGIFTPGVSTTGTFTGPDTMGRGSLFMPGGRTFIYYILSSKVLRMFEGDNIDLTGGSAYAESATVPALSGKFVFQHSGWSSAGSTAAAGQFTAASGTINAGLSDSIAGGSPSVPTTSKPVTGTYTIAAQNGTLNLTDAAGASTFNIYMVDPALNILDPNNTSGGGGALLLHTDASINGTGIIVPQAVSATPSFTASNALNLTNPVVTSTTTNEFDLAGVVTSDGTSKFTSGLSDYDENDSGNAAILPVLGAATTGTFTADTTNPGHFTGTFTVTAGAYPFISASAFSVSFYQASGAQAFVIETDASGNGTGYILLQQFP